MKLNKLFSQDAKAGDSLCGQAARDPGSPRQRKCRRAEPGEREVNRGNERGGRRRAVGEGHVGRDLRGSEGGRSSIVGASGMERRVNCCCL